MSEMQLVIVHVGPVQDFIAAARRSRDLWFGSWLLSELSKAAALEIVRQNGNSVECLIFPAPSNLAELQSEDFNVANKVVAMLNQSPTELGKSVQGTILNRLRAIRDEAYKKVKGGFGRTTAEKQVDDVLEFLWAACPVNGDYGHAREVAESLLAARKGTRDFAAVTWGSSNPKSSLDGQRESVIPEPVYDQMRAGQMTTEQLRRDYGVRVGERLCGVGLLKRHGKRGSGDDRFFSTSHVAALPLLKRLTDETATKKYIESLKQLGISSDELGNVPTSHPVFGRHDGHLLFEERLSEFFEEEDKLKNAKGTLHKFRKAALDDKSPIPYYALLLADGDRMGKAIDAQETAEQHRALSQKLARFTGSAAVIVKDHEGSLVYSGGDDVLTFVPLHTVLACARCLFGYVSSGVRSPQGSGRWKASVAYAFGWHSCRPSPRPICLSPVRRRRACRTCPAHPSKAPCATPARMTPCVRRCLVPTQATLPITRVLSSSRTSACCSCPSAVWRERSRG